MSTPEIKIPHPPSRVEKHAALIVAVLASFMTPFLGSATQVALPTIAREYDLSGVMQAWFQTAYMLGAAMFLLPVGRMADIVGRKRVFTIGVVGTAIVALLTTMVPTPLTLVLIRLLHGMTNKKLR